MLPPLPPINKLYRPGALWRARSWIAGEELCSGNYVNIPAGGIVLVMSYSPNPWNEKAVVLWGEKLVFLAEMDLGLNFDMNPTNKS